MAERQPNQRNSGLRQAGAGLFTLAYTGYTAWALWNGSDHLLHNFLGDALITGTGSVTAFSTSISLNMSEEQLRRQSEISYRNMQLPSRKTLSAISTLYGLGMGFVASQAFSEIPAQLISGVLVTTPYAIDTTRRLDIVRPR